MYRERERKKTTKKPRTRAHNDLEGSKEMNNDKPHQRGKCKNLLVLFFVVCLKFFSSTINLTSTRGGFASWKIL